MKILKQGGFLLIALLMFGVVVSCANSDGLEDGLYAKITTDKGDILLKLYSEKAPLTVLNFVGLAEGTLDKANKEGPFYDGLKFHRVIDNFMIQGGDPQGDGTGGPGYTFVDETSNGLVFDMPGKLAMANRGPGTNGSQFFITREPTDWLNKKHTIFGEVVEGQDIVNAIEQDDEIKKVEILRRGSKASKYKADAEKFEKLEKEIVSANQAASKEKREAAIKTIKEKWPNAIEEKDTQIFFEIKKEGVGEQPPSGVIVTVDIVFSLLDGTVLSNSKEEGQPVQLLIGQGQTLLGMEDQIMKMKQGERRIFIVPPEMSYLGGGTPPGIPPESWLVFDVSLMNWSEPDNQDKGN